MARRGFCARTLTSVGDCEAGTDVSGSWVLSRMHTSSSSAARTECNRLCRSCSHCRFFSYSVAHKDCSWFASCDLDRLEQSVDGFLTEALVDVQPRLFKNIQQTSTGGLAAWQRQNTRSWAAQLDTEQAFVIQIGANDHADRYGNPDPAPWLVRRGWRALLVEPMPPVYTRLRQRYAHNPMVTTLQAAVARECAAGYVPFWGLDFSNASGSWDSEDANGLCAQRMAWLHEISSLDKDHVVAMHSPCAT